MSLPKGGARRLGTLLVILMLLLVTGACGGTEQQEDSAVAVTGDFGRRPQVAFTAPLSIESPSSTVLIEGDGKELQEGSPVLLSYVAYSADTGSVIDESYGREPRTLMLTPEHGPLYEELLGKTEGTRGLLLSQGTAARPEPAVLVYDVLHSEARGEEQPDGHQDPSLPSVTRGEDGRPAVKIPDVDPPLQLKIVTLIKGTGPQVEEGDRLTAHYSSVEWESGTEFDSTWDQDGLVPPAISFAGLIPAWQTGLSGATVGSQIMIIAPPKDAFGTDTVVFVIDLLATTTPEGSTDD